MQVGSILRLKRKKNICIVNYNILSSFFLSKVDTWGVNGKTYTAVTNIKSFVVSVLLSKHDKGLDFRIHGC